MTAFELHVETLKAMAKFYSWPAIIRNLWQFDFFYAVVGLYGKRSVKKALSGARKYLDDVKELITTEFDAKTEKLRQFFPQKKGSTKNIILNTTSLENNESTFFSTFLSQLDKKLIIKKENFKVNKNTLSITPLVKHLKNRHQQGMQQLSDFYEKYRDRMDSIKTINMESISLYKSCVNIGLLLNIEYQFKKNPKGI
jgi:hypothetical protein